MTTDTGTASEIEQLERAGWSALSGPEGAAFYGDVMAEEGLMVFPGTVMARAAALEAIRTTAPWSSFELSEILVVGDAKAAVMAYRAAARRGGDDPYVATMVSVYVRRDGRWRLLLHQQSPGG